jgi:DNA-binding CsgD family transcriptional regulator
VRDDSDWPDEDAGNRGTVSFGSAIDDLGADPTGEQIDEDFCERFYAYLRRPLQEAEEAYEQASTRGRAAAERKRLESIAKKNDRLMTVLVMRIEGRTQEEIAATLELSRNQVKYIVELVQSAYRQFCSAIPSPVLRAAEVSRA